MEKTEILGLKHNVHEICGKHVVRVHGDIDRDIYDYFFMHVIAYTHGARQSLITFFFQRLYEACINEGIAAVWDENNAPRIIALLNRMNFAPMPEIKVDKRKKKS